MSRSRALWRGGEEVVPEPGLAVPYLLGPRGSLGPLGISEAVPVIGELGAELGEEHAECDRIDGGDHDGHAAENRAGDGHAFAAGLPLPRPLDGHDAEHQGHDADHAPDEEEERDDADDAEDERGYGKAVGLLGPVARRRRAVTAGAAPAAGGRWRGAAGGRRDVPPARWWGGGGAR